LLAALSVPLNCSLQVVFGLPNTLRTLVVVGASLGLDGRNHHEHSSDQACNN
jgi:hypothetical protein